MSDFVACVAIEQGGYWIVAGAVFVAVTLLVAIVLCVRAFRRALKDPHSKIAIIVRSWSIKAGGASSAQRPSRARLDRVHDGSVGHCGAGAKGVPRRNRSV